MMKIWFNLSYLATVNVITEAKIDVTETPALAALDQLQYDDTLMIPLKSSNRKHGRQLGHVHLCIL